MTRKNTPPPPIPVARRPETARGLTSEHIEAHLAAFMAAGGKVEVLSTTPVLKRIGGTESKPASD